MTEMTIKIEAAGLIGAIEKLAAALTQHSSPVPPAAAPVPAVPLASAPIPQPMPAAPPAPAPIPQPVPVAPPAPAPAGVPTSTPVYNLDQIAKAGASLVDAGKMEPLMALLGRYGVAAVTQLKPEQYGAFATELRALGAQI